MYDQCGTNIEQRRKVRKQFLLRLKDVVAKEVKSIKTVFG